MTSQQRANPIKPCCVSMLSCSNRLSIRIGRVRRDPEVDFKLHEGGDGDILKDALDEPDLRVVVLELAV